MTDAGGQGGVSMVEEPTGWAVGEPKMTHTLTSRN